MASFPAYATLWMDGFSEKTVPPAVLRTEMETGPPKQIKIRSRAMIHRSVVYAVYSKADYLAFKDWVKTTLNRGTDWFDWTDPVDGSLKSARIVNGDISGEPKDPMLTWWTISFTLETWE